MPPKEAVASGLVAVPQGDAPAVGIYPEGGEARWRTLDAGELVDLAPVLFDHETRVAVASDDHRVKLLAARPTAGGRTLRARALRRVRVHGADALASDPRARREHDRHVVAALGLEADRRAAAHLVRLARKPRAVEGRNDQSGALHPKAMAASPGDAACAAAAASPAARPQHDDCGCGARARALPTSRPGGCRPHPRRRRVGRGRRYP